MLAADDDAQDDLCPVRQPEPHDRPVAEPVAVRADRGEQPAVSCEGPAAGDPEVVQARPAERRALRGRRGAGAGEREQEQAAGREKGGALHRPMLSHPPLAKTAAIAVAGVNATDCIPEAIAPCVPAQASSCRSSSLVRSTRRTASSVSVVSASTVFPCPLWKYSNDGFLSPPMFASRIERSGLTGARSIT